MLLEPIMTVEVVTPEENMGDVVGDLNRRRGLISGMDDCAAGKIVNAEVPLARCLAMLLIFARRPRAVRPTPWSFPSTPRHQVMLPMPLFQKTRRVDRLHIERD